MSTYKDALDDVCKKICQSHVDLQSIRDKTPPVSQYFIDDALYSMRTVLLYINALEDALTGEQINSLL